MPSPLTTRSGGWAAAPVAAVAVTRRKGKDQAISNDHGQSPAPLHRPGWLAIAAAMGPRYGRAVTDPPRHSSPHLRLPGFPRRPGAGDRPRDGRRAHAGGDADRRGQVALLPGAGAGAGRAPALVISPLIALMHDQIRAAEALRHPRRDADLADDNRERDDRAAAARRARPALRRARARDRRALPRSARARRRSRCSRSTRRIASPNGAMTSGPITGCCCPLLDAFPTCRASR